MNVTKQSRALTPALLLLIALFTPQAFASSHREAPAISLDPAADNTDVYAFVSPDRPGTTTLIANWCPIQEPAGGPNFFSFDDDALYTVWVDNDGDAVPELRYDFQFQTTVLNPSTFLYNTGAITSLDDADLNVRQTYRVTRYEEGVPTVLGENVPVAPARVGPRSTPDYETLAAMAVRELSDGSRVFAGPRDDAFFVDLGGVFDLLSIRKLPGDKGKGQDDLAGFNTLTISLQIPHDRLTADGSPPGEGNSVIGVYSTTSRRATRTLNADGTISHSGDWVQVSRLGNPLVNEVVIPRGSKNRFNASNPVDDAQFLDSVIAPELAGLFTLLFGVSVPPAPRNDLVAVFLTGVPGLNQPAGVVASEYLRLNLAISPASAPNRLGVLAGDLAGFPNGRRLADDVTDVALRVVAGVLVPGFDIEPNNRLGDGIDANDLPFLPVFPYQALPHSGFEHDHHLVQHGASAWSAGGRGRAAAAPSSGDARRLQLAGPNPATQAQLEYALDRPGRVHLKVYDVAGRIVRTLIEQDSAAGSFRATWDGRDQRGVRAAPGVYLVRLETEKGTDERKVVLR